MDFQKYDGFISGLLPGDELMLTEAYNKFDIIDESKHLRKDGRLIVFLHVQASSKTEMDDFFSRMLIGSTNDDQDTEGDF